jgi:hypothetical protein
VRAASECKSERKTNDVKSAKKNQQLMIGFWFSGSVLS